MSQLAALAAVFSALVVPAQEVRYVDPPDLTRRPELIGKQVAVDARVRLYQLHGSVFDEILLHGTPAVLRLPPRLAFTDPPTSHNLLASGTLRHENGRYFLDVESIQLQESDEKRLERGIAALAPGDVETRRRWSSWATRRARLYDDDALASRARALEAELIRIEASKPDARSAEHAMALARLARGQGIGDPLPGALAHRAFSQLSRANLTPESLDTLADEVAAFLPDSTAPHRADLAAWEKPYQNDPCEAYLSAPEDVRKALDRRLLADLVERSLRARASANPSTALKLADEASARLPDRPMVAATLREQGLSSTSRDVSQLRRAEVLERVQQYEQAGKPEMARTLLRDWLADRRANLGRNELYERLTLAQDFDELAKDREVAIDLLREAAALEPTSESVHQAFRRLGYQRRGEEWILIGSASKPQNHEGAPASAVTDDPIVGLTPEEVATRLGPPNRRSQVITQGRVTLQWVYTGSSGSTQFVVNFVKQPGFPSRAVSRYTPR